MEASWAPELFSQLALPLGTLATLQLNDSSFVQEQKFMFALWWGGGRCVKVICRSMGYAHGSISSSPCSFYGGADLCGAAGTPVECLSFAIMCADLIHAFVS